VTSLRRAFVAIVPPPDVLDAVEAALAPIRRVAPPGLKWSRRAQWHLTLQFLGAADADVVIDSLVGNLYGRAPVRLGLGGAGAFPSVARGSVVWLGLDEGHDALASLVGAVERATEPLGFEPDSRAFHPHLTVARSSRARPLGSVVASLGDGPVGAAWEARAVVLMESDTRPTGAVHREIAHVPLGG
jgi:2'-5' RNA ligase